MKDGTFTVSVSQGAGKESCTYGVPISSLSTGDCDICALALLLSMPGLQHGLTDALPSFVLLDEVDSRLDKRHARALWRFLSGPQGPRQCLVLSLNNHGSFSNVALNL